MMGSFIQMSTSCRGYTVGKTVLMHDPRCTAPAFVDSKGVLPPDPGTASLAFKIRSTEP